MSRRAAGGLLVLSAALASCASPAAHAGSTSTTSSSTTTTAPAGDTGGGGLPAAKISWTSCQGRFECGKLAVPISYSDPSEGVLHLAVIELPATGANPVGDVVLNPGGPGASGLQFLEQSVGEFPAALRGHFNLVSFDPRGIGASEPVTCLPPAGIRALVALPPAPVTPAQESTVEAATRRFVAGCVASVPHDVLENLSTAVTARDLDRLRVALGQAKLTYLGFSYGTFLGATYAQLFPTHVRAMVLDGAVDPALDTQDFEEQQAAAFEQDLHDFLSWCGGSGLCGTISTSGDPQRTYEQLIARFAGGMTEPAAVPPSFGGPQTVTYGIALLGVLTGLYSPSSWPDLGAALTQAEQGNGLDLALFADLYAGQQEDGSFANIVSAETAISCLDRPVPQGIATYEAFARHLATVAPDFGAAEAWGSLSCTYWPVPPTGGPFTVHAPGLPPVLVVGSTHDPATPYRWAQELTAQLPGGELLTRTGDGHTAYTNSSCVRSWVDRYLTTLALPPPRTVCASDGSGLP